MDHGVREQAFDRAVREPTGLGLGHVRELEVVNPGGRHVTDRWDPEESQRFLDALRFRVQHTGFQFDSDFDADRRCVRGPDLPASSTGPER